MLCCVTDTVSLGYLWYNWGIQPIKVNEGADTRWSPVATKLIRNLFTRPPFTLPKNPHPSKPVCYPCVLVFNPYVLAFNVYVMVLLLVSTRSATVWVLAFFSPAYSIRSRLAISLGSQTLITLIFSIRTFLWEGWGWDLPAVITSLQIGIAHNSRFSPV